MMPGNHSHAEADQPGRIGRQADAAMDQPDGKRDDRSDRQTHRIGRQRCQDQQPDRHADEQAGQQRPDGSPIALNDGGTQSGEPDDHLKGDDEGDDLGRRQRQAQQRNRREAESEAGEPAQDRGGSTPAMVAIRLDIIDLTWFLAPGRVPPEFTAFRFFVKSRRKCQSAGCHLSLKRSMLRTWCGGQPLAARKNAANSPSGEFRSHNAGHYDRVEGALLRPEPSSQRFFIFS